MTEKSLIFTFQDEESEGVSQSYSLSLDTDYFLIENGIEKITFDPSDEVFLKLIPPASVEEYELHSSLGDLTTKHSDILYEVSETIFFKKSTFAKLSHNPHSIISYSWVGSEKGTPSFVGQNVFVSTETVGILEVVYTTKGDRLSLKNCISSDTEFQVLCLAEFTDRMIDMTVSFEDGTILGKTDVTLIIKDVITGEPITDASVEVYKDNLLIFSGNVSYTGKVIVPDLLRGEKYDIKATATNYFASGEDYLNNDSFIVPES